MNNNRDTITLNFDKWVAIFTIISVLCSGLYAYSSALTKFNALSSAVERHDREMSELKAIIKEQNNSFKDFAKSNQDLHDNWLEIKTIIKQKNNN